MRDLFPLQCLAILCTVVFGCLKNPQPKDSVPLATVEDAVLHKREKWLERVSYPLSFQAPVRPSPHCALAHIILLLPNSTSGFGHAALAVGQDFFDFGPLEKGWVQALTQKAPWQIRALCQYIAPSPGGYAWSRQPESNVNSGQSRDFRAISFEEALLAIKTNSDLKDYVILDIPLEISLEQAVQLKKWWSRDEIRKGKLIYQIPGHHCSSMVVDSLAEVLGINGFTYSKLVSPSYLAYYMLGDGSDEDWLKYRHTCGPRKGRIVKASFLNFPLKPYLEILDRLLNQQKVFNGQ